MDDLNESERKRVEDVTLAIFNSPEERADYLLEHGRDDDALDVLLKHGHVRDRSFHVRRFHIVPHPVVIENCRFSAEESMVGRALIRIDAIGVVVTNTKVKLGGQSFVNVEIP